MNAEQTLTSLSERNPTVAPDELIAGLVPPPQFEDVSFASYRTDPNEPSQAEARAKDNGALERASVGAPLRDATRSVRNWPAPAVLRQSVDIGSELS